MASKGSLLYSQQPAICSCRDQINPVHARSILFLKIDFNIIFPPMPRPSSRQVNRK